MAMSKWSEPAQGVENLYIHIPFCSSKCHYCAFYSVPRIDSERRHYVAQLCREYDLLGLPESKIKTIFVGGGTPSLLGASGFAILAEELRVRGLLEGVEEWSVELNPESADDELLAALKEAGVNRLSMGAQSFDTDTLVKIGRRHDDVMIEDAVKRMVKAGFDNFNLDFIAGLPGVTMEMWHETLLRAVGTGSPHLSVYGLILEPGTILEAQVAQGLKLPGADEQLDAVALTEELLSGNGFERYEISNYAKPGHRCRHNLAVWHGEDYLGLGPSASSRMGRRRWTNQSHIYAWLKAIAAGELPRRSEDEELSEEDDMLERRLYNLRLDEGVAPSALGEAAPALAWRVPRWERVLSDLAKVGITERHPRAADHWRLTRRGREVADAVLLELL